MEKTEWIIFDFGGVIGKPQVQEEVDIMVSLSGLEKEVFLKNYFGERGDYDIGSIDQRTYWSRILKVSPGAMTEELLEKLVEADAKSWCDINPATIACIKELKAAGKNLALLSNINFPILDYLKEETSALTHFKKLYCSCELELLKPGKEIYDYVVKDLGVPAHQCVFIDDTPSNVEGAKSAGIKGIHYISTGDLRKQLLC